MKKSLSLDLRVNTMVIFWLGMLTGALIVGLVFFYKFISPDLYGSEVLRGTTIDSTIDSVETTIDPTLERDYTSIDSTVDYAIDPTIESTTSRDGIYAFPTPPGN